MRLTGAASALLSAAALSGVVFSLALQRKQAYTAQVEALRNMHKELIVKALEEPAYVACWGGPFAPEGVDERLMMYVNLVISYWSAKWDLGQCTERGVQGYATDLFASRVGCLYWGIYGEGRIGGESKKKKREFLRIIDSVYRHSITQGPPTRKEYFEFAQAGPRLPSGQVAARKSLKGVLIFGLAAAVVTTVAGSAVRRKR